MTPFPDIDAVSRSTSDRWRAAYEQAVVLAEAAAKSGTFGVGGLLVEPTGAILATARNRVVEEGRLGDPTAHVERQLIDWYFANQDQSEMPPPEGVTVLSSLEPCMMCAGAILIARMRCVALAEDRSSGVGVLRGLRALPPALRSLAVERFAMPSVEGVRQGTSVAVVPWMPSDLPIETAKRSTEAFQQSLQRVRETMHARSREPHGGSRSGSSDEVVSSTRIPPIPGRFWVRSRPEASPQPKALEIIESLRAGDGRGRQVACLLDSSGGLVCAASDATDRSPIRTAVLENIRLFASVVDLLPSRAGSGLKASGLTMVVTMPFGSDAEIVCSLGGVGSFLEGPIEPRALPYVQLLDASSADVAYVRELLARFPPFYTEDIGFSVGASSSRRLTTGS